MNFVVTGSREGDKTQSF